MDDVDPDDGGSPRGAKKGLGSGGSWRVRTTDFSGLAP